jgi:hypothetical protein
MVNQAVTALFDKVMQDDTRFGPLGGRRSKEYGIVVKPDGSTIEIAGETNDNAIFISDELLKEMEGADFIHTHPTGSSFSKEDVLVASEGKLNSIQAVGVDWKGQKWHYAISPKSGEKWPSENVLEFEFNFYKELQIHSGNAKLDAAPDMKATLAMIPEVTFAHGHEIWKRVARDNRMDYKRKRIN